MAAFSQCAPLPSRLRPKGSAIDKVVSGLGHAPAPRNAAIYTGKLYARARKISAVPVSSTRAGAARRQLPRNSRGSRRAPG